jgi:hypothetical protein
MTCLSDSNNTDPVRALPAKWRGSWAEGYMTGDPNIDEITVARAAAKEECADELESALSSAPPSAPVVDAWKNAVLDALAGTGMDAAPDEPPYSVLNRIIRWHEDVATDPALSQQPAAIPRLANCGKYTATDNNGQHYYLNHANTWQTFQGQQPAPHPAITHCDNCGCDWLDNGLNPIGCPYCKQPAAVDRDVAWILLRGSQGEPAGTMTVSAKLQDGSEVVLIRDSGNVIDHAVNLAAALAAQQQEVPRG